MRRQWSSFSLNILNPSPSAYIVFRPLRPIPNRCAEVAASIAVRGEQNAVGDSGLIDHDWFSL
ncbi:MAG: hypothetical protein WBF44_11590 [Pseudolabrys sp.]